MRNRIQKLVAILLPMVMLILLTGCWNRTELNEIGITAATGIDRVGKDWTVTYQVIVPSAMASSSGGASSGSSQAAVHVFSTKAEAIEKANNLTNLENPRRLFIAHNNAVVIGDRAAREGVAELIDLYLRKVETRETVLMLITEGRASETLKKLVPPEKLPGLAIAEILRQEERNASIFPVVSIYDFAMGLTSDAKTNVIPVIALSGDTEGDKPEKLESTEATQVTSPPVKLRLVKLALFREDRLVGFANREESYGLTWMRGKVHGSVVSFPMEGAQAGKASSFRITSASAKITPVKKGDRFTMRIRVKLQGILTETVTGKDLSDPRVIHDMEKEIAKTVEQQVRTGWAVVQREKLDLAGFADRIHRKYPKDWAKLKEGWEDELGRLELDVAAKATIKRPGFMQKSFGSIKKSTEEQ
ncbi:Ger(x)C family spore germination protein [Paenibacillus sp. CN-4]|uniref:Ger(x)C family spore germination protein n=1 Tax=Paenibacillus nanchangensis TaxID=3348343 RepID=UPI00397DEF21